MIRYSKWLLLVLLNFVAAGRLVSDFGAAAPDEYRAVPVVNRHANQWLITSNAHRYPFIDTKASQLVFPGERETFELFYNKLEQSLYAGGEAVNILHMGGSHVQAGMIGHQIRSLFNDFHRGTVSERGLIVPYRVGKTNSSVYTGSRSTGDWVGCRCAAKKDECTWGMTGFTLSTFTDSATIHSWAFDRDSVHYTGDRVRVYHNFQRDRMKLDWAGEAVVHNIETNEAQGYTEFNFEQPVDTISFMVTKDSLATGQFEIHGFWLGDRDDKGGLRYHEIGVNGASTKSYLRCEQMEKQLGSLSPDLVIFGIGVNDAHGRPANFSVEKFMNRYDSLIAVIKAQNPDAALLFLTNSDNYYRGRPNPNGVTVQDAMYRLAEKHQGAVWDLFAVMGGLGAVYDWQRAGLARNDKIHFTKKGYQLQAELLYLALTDGFSSYLLSRYATVSDLQAPLPQSK